MVVSLLHFDRPYQHAKHALGSCHDLERRVTQHGKGRGARLLEVVQAVSITVDQVAQLNATNTYVSDPTLVDEPDLFPPGPSSPPGPSRVELLFLDGRGGIITRSTFTVAPGQTVSLPLAGARLISGKNRATIRAVVHVLDYAVVPQTGAALPDPFIATLEVYDSQTGKTQFIMNPGTLRGVNPLPEPPSAQ
jgi:hypothetical protein